MIRGLYRLIDGLFFTIPAQMSMQYPLFQRLGDKKAKTVVVGARDPSFHQARAWWWLLVAAALNVILFIFFSIATIILMIQ